MKKHIMSLLAMMCLSTVGMADEINITPTIVTKIQKGDYADTEMYDPTATSWTTNFSTISNGAFTDQLTNYGGSCVVFSKFDIGAIPADVTITKATFTFNSICTVDGRNSQLAVANINPGVDFSIATWNSDNNSTLQATKVADLSYSTSTATTKQVCDITEIIREIYKNGESNVAFAAYTNTGREQKVSAFNITIEYTVGHLRKYNYTVNAVDENDNLIVTLHEGEEYEGIVKEVYFPHFLLNGGRNYIKTVSNYGIQVHCDTTVNLKYTEYERDIRAYTEMEDITPGAKESGQYSNGNFGHVLGGKTAYLCKLPAGKYTFYAYLVERGDRGIFLRDMSNPDIEKNIIVSTEFSMTTATGIKLMTFNLTEETEIGISGRNATADKTNQSAGMDYVYIVRTGDYIPPVFPKDMSNVIPDTWICEQGEGPTDYEGAADVYTTSSYDAGRVIYQRIEGLQPGRYKVEFYATANMMFFGANYGSKIAQAYCNEQFQDINVINQTGCVPTEYPHSFEITTTDGIIEYGLRNIKMGGNWYVCKSNRITQLDSLTIKEQMQGRLKLARELVTGYMNKDVQNVLSAAIGSTTGYGLMTDEEVVPMLAPLNQAIDSAKNSIEVYKAVYDTYQDYLQKAKQLDEAGLSYYEEAVKDILQAYNDSTLSEDKSADIIDAYLKAQDAQLVHEPIEIVGSEDCTSEYDESRSALMAVENGQTLHYEFENFTDRKYNYDSWMLIVKSSLSSPSSNIILRNDAWENVSRSDADCTNNFNWSTFLNDMNGAFVIMDVTYRSGKVTMAATITTADGKKTYTYKYQKNGFTQNVLFMYLTNLKSYQKIYKADITGEPEPTTAIDGVGETPHRLHDGKYLEDGNIIIRKGENTYQVNGVK